MSLALLKVFNEYTKLAKTEVLQQQIDLFNAATRGAMVLRLDPKDGDFADTSYWKRMSGLVRFRDAYGSGAVSAIDLEQLAETSVKVAASTPPVKIDPSRMTWILKNPEEQGAIYGQQLAVEALAQKVNTAIGALRSALVQTGSTLTQDKTNNASWKGFNSAVSKFGDRGGRIAVWVAHSKIMYDIWGDNLANAAGLFRFGDVNVIQDPWGRPIIMTDSSSLINPTGIDDGDGSNADGDAGGSTPVPSYYTLGLVPGAAMITDNGDYLQNFDTRNGFENITTTVQAEWTYNVAVKGYAWDKANGGKSPNLASLTTGTNWDKVATDVKDLPGVVLETK